MDTGAKTLVAQDFRHASQQESELVGEFIRRLERIFQIAYGGDIMSTETRHTLLLGQLKEGLKYNIFKGLAVSGALTYQGLCLAVKNEEKHQAELRKHVQYKKYSSQKPAENKPASPISMKQPPQLEKSTIQNKGREFQRRYYNCGVYGHIF